MTEAQALEAILEAWEDGWLELHPSDPQDPDYVPFSIDNEAHDSEAKWVRVTVRETSRLQTTSGPKGTKRVEVRGRVAVQIFCDVDLGPLELAKLADDVRAVLECATITANGQEIALFEAPAMPPPTPDGRWNMGLLSTAYLYTTLR